MSAFIPYSHPSLTLGRVVDQRILGLMGEIGAIEKKTEAAFEKMNSLISMRRGMRMTMEELIGMGIETPDIRTRLTELDAAIKSSAQDYMTLRLSNDTQIQGKLVELADVDVDDALDSPVDFEESKPVSRPVGSDSMRLDMQYFSYGDSDEDVSATVIRIGDAIREMTADVGKESNKIARLANQQLNQQVKSHNLSGTLVITATCTHRNALMLQPLTLDADRTLEIWNHLHGESAEIDTADLPRMARIAQSVKGGADGLEGTIALLVGTNLGSSFVGMVHTVDHDEFVASRTAENVAGMEDKVRLGGWLSGMSGQLGIDQEVGKEIRDMLGHRQVFAHVNIIAMGVVPSFVADGKGDTAKEALKTQGQRGKDLKREADKGSAGSAESPQTLGKDARTAEQLANIDGKMTSDLLNGLGKLDALANQTLDINSMMIGFDNYIGAINKKDDADDRKLGAGVPIGYYVRRIGAATVARLWLDKYFPGFSPFKVTKAAADAGSKSAPGAGSGGTQRRN